jgi:hypothetical protein
MASRLSESAGTLAMRNVLYPYIYTVPYVLIMITNPHKIFLLNPPPDLQCDFRLDPDPHETNADPKHCFKGECRKLPAIGYTFYCRFL